MNREYLIRLLNDKSGMVRMAVMCALLLNLQGCGLMAQHRNECQWYCFHGSDRTNKSDETGLLPAWPDDGPPLIWTASGLGEGYSGVSGEKIVPEAVWHTELMDNHHGGVILHEGYLYGAGHNKRGWFCLDFLTGEPRWKAQGKGSLTYADNRLYCLEERGIMNLVEATPEKYNPTGTFNVPSGGKGMYWAHPVVCGGRLYIRHTDKLFVFDIKEQ